MAKPPLPSGLAVPSKRLARLWHLGRATGDLAAGVGLRGLFELALNRDGEMNRIRLSPERTQRFTDRLARMRGAAMKMGQLMSLDGSDIFSPEAAGIMASLRDRAQPMPLGQVNQVLSGELGADWDKRFHRFNFTPIAAASIGQVHEAETRDGRHLAIKIQFPGVRESIDSDLDNFAFLGQTLGLAPKSVNLEPILTVARRQLHQEADYLAEADALEAYGALVGDDPDLLVPKVHRDLSSTRVLAMDFATGIPVDQLTGPAFRQVERDRAATLLVRLLLRELFDFALVQTDPNYSNFLYQAETRKLVLLDFGATERIAPTLVGYYRQMMQASVIGDTDVVRQCALALGYLDPDAAPEQAAGIAELIALTGEPLRHAGLYDFGASDLFERIFVGGRELFYEDAFGRNPDPATFFLHRKFVGTFMLCRRLRARVDLNELTAAYG
ncbi:AarF/ABC1/UbiB kinase family protein [uncultured Lamprocystis sp.]|uniref:ABC1 kinase family protein n=1 Tax=uncultured Lamprocystis sp. TaxID=543132 RepID=UPI0025E1847E|nr:AarF/ABC1/UbiB kinase family protein [uncultured Lamprocystis sp.]